MSGGLLDADTAVTSPVRIVAYGQQIRWWQASLVATPRLAFSEQPAEIKVVTRN
jgi:hypothetical protein